MLLGGEAGVGKTALLRRFRDGLDPAVRSPLGACHPLRTPTGRWGRFWESPSRLAASSPSWSPAWRVRTLVSSALLTRATRTRGPDRARPRGRPLGGRGHARRARSDRSRESASVPDPGARRAIAMTSSVAADCASAILGEVVREAERMHVEPLSRGYGRRTGRGSTAPTATSFTAGPPATRSLVTEALAAGDHDIPVQPCRDAVICSCHDRLPPEARRPFGRRVGGPGTVETVAARGCSSAELVDRRRRVPGVGHAGSAGSVRLVAFRTSSRARRSRRRWGSPNRRGALHRRAGGDAQLAAAAKSPTSPGWPTTWTRRGAMRARSCAGRRSRPRAAALSGAHREAAAQYALRAAFRGQACRWGPAERSFCSVARTSVS